LPQNAAIALSWDQRIWIKRVTMESGMFRWSIQITKHNSWLMVSRTTK